MCAKSSLKYFASKLWTLGLLTCSSVVSVSAPVDAQLQQPAISVRPEWSLSWAWPAQKRSMLLEMEPEDWQVAPQSELELTKAKKQRKKKKRKKKKQGHADKKKRRHKKKPMHVSLGQPANVLLANLATLPVPRPHHVVQPQHVPPTTRKPLKSLLHKGSLLKKKKQQYLSHLGYVFYPLVKFVTFFTVLNPFTLAVFFFMLISPIVFGLLGFTAISLILKPIMSLLFAVKRRVAAIGHRRPQRKRPRPPPRPITIHKHYYQHQQQQQQQQPKPHRIDHAVSNTPRPQFNPILPQVRLQLLRQL